MHEHYSSVCKVHGNPVEGSTLPAVLQACQVSTVLVFTQMWPKIQFPESWNDQDNQKLCVINTSVSQENSSVISKMFKFRIRN